MTFLEQIMTIRATWSSEDRQAYYEHVRDNCGGWTEFAKINTSASGWEHELAFHRKRQEGLSMSDQSKETVTYDSRADTLEHIREVNKNLLQFTKLLLERAIAHDDSKLVPPEKPHFDRETPNLKNLVFNSPEYKESLGRLQDALKHHYVANDHHPEHFHSGVNGMNLMQIVEMLMDWIAASKRNKTGKLDLQSCYSRFGFDPQLAAIFTNTALALNANVQDETL